MNKKQLQKNLQEIALDKRSRAKVVKALRRRTEAEISQLLDAVEEEFQRRPRLQQVVLVAHKRHPRSLGRGCTAIVVHRDGTVSKRFLSGAYGAVLVV